MRLEAAMLPSAPFVLSEVEGRAAGLPFGACTSISLDANGLDEGEIQEGEVRT